MSKHEESWLAREVSQGIFDAAACLPQIFRLSPEKEPVTSDEMVRWIDRKLEYMSADLITKVSGQDITVFIGNTRAGKSTLVKYLSGSNLEAVYWSRVKSELSNDSDTWVNVEHTSENRFYHSKDDAPRGAKLVVRESNVSDSSIGFGAGSCTTIPKASFSVVHLSKVSTRGILWDMPGFDHNTGIHQDILNAFCIREVLQNARSVKFVVVSDASELFSSNVRLFTETISKTSYMFAKANIQSILNNMSLIITKGAEDINRERVIDELSTNIIDSGIVLDPGSKAIINHFISHPEHIGFFHMKKAPGHVHCNTFPMSGHDSLITAIQAAGNIAHSYLQDIMPPISDASHIFLMKEYMKFRETKDFVNVSNVYDASLMRSDLQFISDLGMSIEEWVFSMQESVVPLIARVGDARERQSEDLWKILEVLVPDSHLSAKAKFIKFIDDQNLGSTKLIDIFTKQVIKAIAIIEHKIELFRVILEEQDCEVHLVQFQIENAKIMSGLTTVEHDTQDLKKQQQEAEKLYKAKYHANVEATSAQKIAIARFEAAIKSHHAANVCAAKKKQILDEEIAKVVVTQKAYDEAKIKESTHTPKTDAAKYGGICFSAGAATGAAVGAGIGAIVTASTFGVGAPTVSVFAAWGAGIGGSIGGVSGASVGYRNAKSLLDSAIADRLKAEKDYNLALESKMETECVVEDAGEALSNANINLQKANISVNDARCVLEELAIQVKEEEKTLQGIRQEYSQKFHVQKSFVVKLQEVQEKLSKIQERKGKCVGKVEALKDALKILSESPYYDVVLDDALGVFATAGSTVAAAAAAAASDPSDHTTDFMGGDSALD